MRRWGYWIYQPEHSRLVHGKSGAWVDAAHVRAYREIPGAVEHMSNDHTCDRQDILHLVAALIDIIGDREHAR
jgi:hypothetical protein